MNDTEDIEESMSKKDAVVVRLPRNTAKISNGAFKDCVCLKYVAFYSGLTEIGQEAFSGCESLSSVVIPESVTEIGYWAFNKCKSLSSVEFGGTVAQWEAVKGKLELLKCVPATTVKCSDGEWQKPVVLVENGVLAKCFDRSATSFTILEGVTKIGSGAFSGCESLSSVEFGGNMAQWEAVKGKLELLGYVPTKTVKCSDGEWQKPVVLVEDGVAVLCLDESATSITIPEGVTEIGYEAFAYCDSLTSVVIGEGVTKIGNNAFLECTSLKSVVIGEGVTEIGEHAFRNCESLTSVVIPEGVTEIGEEAFCWCKSLESVVIPEGVTEIGDGAFEGCESLTSLEFGGTRSQWKAIERGDDWNEDVPAETVKCTDGEVKI